MKRTENGFTLIEMLVVCLIVVLLAGLVFRMVAASGRAGDVATTKTMIEMVGHALEEFKSIYGKYPPVRLYPRERGRMPMIGYEYPSAHFKTYGDTWEEWNHAAQLYHETGGRLSDWTEKGDGIFTFGLCSFFVPRVNGAAGEAPPTAGGQWRGSPFLSKQYRPEQWTAFNTGNESGDSRRDLDAVRRILPHLDGRLGDDDCPVVEKNKWGNHNIGILSIPWDGYKRSGDTKTNGIVTIRDAWGHDLFYYSVPPYESYRLWSAGPDGMTSGDKCKNSAHGHVNGIVADGDPETLDDIWIGKN